MLARRQDTAVLANILFTYELARRLQGTTVTVNLLARVTASRAGLGRLNAAGRRAFLGPYRERPVRRRAAAMLRDAATASDFLRRLDARLPTALSDRPVLLVFGSASPTVKERFPQRWRRSFPDAELLLVDGGHHFPMNDAPDLVAGAISWWTSAVASPEASS